MTSTGRALATGPVVLVLVLLVTAAAAAPPGPTRDVVDPSASPGPAPRAASETNVTLPPLTDILGTLLLAAVCGAALALFSVGPRQTARARLRRRR